MTVKWLYTHWRWRGNSAVLINVGLLLGFFALDVRDLYYKTVWLGPYEDLAYDPHGVQPFDPEPLVPTLPVATLQSGDLMEQPSGWPSMLERCALLHGFGFFLAALGKNCSVGPTQYPMVVPELVLGASLRVDAVAWASCKLLYLHRRPRFCQVRGVSGFLHRYNLEDRRIPPSAMASEGSIAEMELLELLAVITSSSPLERTVCVEGFAAVNGNVSAASIYGCGSPNIFKSVLAGHYATALHSLLYDKAWLAVDELNIMGVKFVIRQNSHLTSTYRVVEQSDGTSTRHTEIHSRANFSASGPLYCLVITTDIVLLLLHVHSALQIFRHALIPQLRRRQHAESGPRPQSMRPQNPPPPRRDATSTAIGQRWSHHVDFSMLSRSLYRSHPVVILTAITHLISWQVVIPSSVIWTWSVDTLDQLQSFITILRVWVLVLISFNAVWDIVTGISERFAYAIARRAYVTTLELLGVGATVSYLIRDEVFAITTTKYDIDKQRYTDVFSFAGAVAYTNSYNDNQDAVWNTSWGLIGVVYKPLMRTIGLSILGLFLLYSSKPPLSPFDSVGITNVSIQLKHVASSSPTMSGSRSSGCSIGRSAPEASSAPTWRSRRTSTASSSSPSPPPLTRASSWTTMAICVHVEAFSTRSRRPSTSVGSTPHVDDGPRPPPPSSPSLAATFCRHIDRFHGRRRSSSASQPHARVAIQRISHPAMYPFVKYARVVRPVLSADGPRGLVFRWYTVPTWWVVACSDSPPRKCRRAELRSMYNGIGLRTVRGSGTNGYVQRNLSYVNPNRTRQTLSRNQQTHGRGAWDAPSKSKPTANPDILLHEQKRQIEVKLMELSMEMEERGCDEDEIQDKVQREREKLVKQLESATAKASRSGRPDDSTHARAQRKEEENRRMKEAFGIAEDHVPGESFDPEMQAKRREERIARRKKEQEEREAARQLRIKEREERRERDRDRSAGRSGRGRIEKARSRSRSRDRDRRRRDHSRSRERSSKEEKKRKTSRSPSSSPVRSRRNKPSRSRSASRGSSSDDEPKRRVDRRKVSKRSRSRSRPRSRSRSSSGSSSASEKEQEKKKKSPAGARKTTRWGKPVPRPAPVQEEKPRDQSPSPAKHVKRDAKEETKEDVATDEKPKTETKKPREDRGRSTRSRSRSASSSGSSDASRSPSRDRRGAKRSASRSRSRGRPAKRTRRSVSPRRARHRSRSSSRSSSSSRSPSRSRSRGRRR